jgi:hypothetical protein
VRSDGEDTALPQQTTTEGVFVERRAGNDPVMWGRIVLRGRSFRKRSSRSATPEPPRSSRICEETAPSPCIDCRRLSSKSETPSRPVRPPEGSAGRATVPRNS